MSARLALLADVALLVAFAAIGRSNHHEAGSFARTLLVAAPFVLGWLGGVAVARLDRSPLSAQRAARAWAVAAPLGLALRRLAFGRGIAPGFVVVALVFTLVTLVGWRLVVGPWLRRHQAAGRVRR